jgi:hypothetical protein
LGRGLESQGGGVHSTSQALTVKLKGSGIGHMVLDVGAHMSVLLTSVYWYSI